MRACVRELYIYIIYTEIRHWFLILTPVYDGTDASIYEGVNYSNL